MHGKFPMLLQFLKKVIGPLSLIIDLYLRFLYPKIIYEISNKSYIAVFRRPQIVKYKNYLSDSIKNVTSSVPQDDHMLLLLFSLFINDISKNIRNSSVSY